MKAFKIKLKKTRITQLLKLDYTQNQDRKIFKLKNASRNDSTSNKMINSSLLSIFLFLVILFNKILETQ